jgi:hypothetical protein
VIQRLIHRQFSKHYQLRNANRGFVVRKVTVRKVIRKVTDLFVGRFSLQREENPPMAVFLVDEFP